MLELGRQDGLKIRWAVMSVWVQIPLVVLFINFKNNKIMAKHVILNTSYGEILVKEGSNNSLLDCYIGNNYDEYIGSIEGTIYDDENSLINKIEKLLK